MSDGNIGSSSADLSTNNFKYVKSVKGKSQTVMILGFGVANAGLVANAVEDLKGDLVDNQALINIALDKNVTVWFGGIVVNKTVRVSADVVEFY